MWFDSKGKVGTIDTRNASNRRITKVKVGDTFTGMLNPNYLTIPVNKDDCLSCKKLMWEVIEVYPRIVRARCVDDERIVTTFDLGDLVRLGVEPANPGWVVERKSKQYGKMGEQYFSDMQIKKAKRELKVFEY